MGAWDENFGGSVATVADQDRAPAPMASAQSPRSAWDENFSPAQPQPAQRQEGRSGAAEPDAPSWLGRRWQDLKGKRDANYDGLPTIAEVMKGDGSMTLGNIGREAGAWLTGASDKDMGGVYAKQLGDRFVRHEVDANGYPVIVYRGKDGHEAKAYVNAPGLDMQDTGRAFVGLAPYVGAGRLVSGAMKGAGLVPRMVGQAAGQGATSATQDAAGFVTGVSDLDLMGSAGKAGMAAAGGAVGEIAGQALSYGWRKLVTEPRYFNRSTGQLTPAGEDAARAAGLDPATLPQDMTRTFGQALAKTGNAVEAARPTISNEFRIPLTQGEMAGSKQQLLREQQMHGGTFGADAAGHMDRFRKSQDLAIDNATRGTMSPNVPGVAGKLAPDRAGTGARLGRDELGANIRANSQAAYDAAKKNETAAWKAVPEEFRASDEALAAIDTVIPNALKARGVRVIEEGLTPAAKRMSDMLEQFQAGKMPETASKYVDRSLAGHVDIMRRRLLAGMDEAATNTDRAASKALYDGFNDWVVEAAKLSGDPSIAAKMVTARGISREIHEFFDGPKGSAGARIMSNVLKKADSAEGIVNALFSAPSRGEVKSGAVHALDALKRSYDRFLPKDAAKGAWDDIRLAYWMRIAETKTGDVGGPQALATSIKTAINSQGSIAKKLYTAQELGQMNRLVKVLESVAQRNPNTSWSGVSVGSLTRDVWNAVLSSIGANSIVARTAIGTALKPISNVYGRESARAATGNGFGAAPASRGYIPPLAGVGGGTGRGQE